MYDSSEIDEDDSYIDWRGSVPNFWRSVDFWQTRHFSRRRVWVIEGRVRRTRVGWRRKDIERIADVSRYLTDARDRRIRTRASSVERKFDIYDTLDFSLKLRNQRQGSARIFRLWRILWSRRVCQWRRQGILRRGSVRNFWRWKIFDVPHETCQFQTSDDGMDFLTLIDWHWVKKKGMTTTRISINEMMSYTRETTWLEAIRFLTAMQADAINLMWKT